MSAKLTCQEVVDQLWEYLDDDARQELCRQIDEHIGDCSHCRVEVDSLRRTISLYRVEENVCTPVRLSERLKNALDDVYRERARG